MSLALKLIGFFLVGIALAQLMWLHAERDWRLAAVRASSGFGLLGTGLWLVTAHG